MGEPWRLGEGPRGVVDRGGRDEARAAEVHQPHGSNGRGLLDATSGNTGIAYAMLGAALRFPVTLCMPSNVSEERKRYLRAYGAKVVWTNPADGSDGAIRKAREMAAAEPERYLLCGPVFERENWRAHYRTTANEIWEQTEGQVTHFVAALGTSGTFMGTTRRLKELNPEIQCVSMQPDSPFNGLEGLKHMATAIVPKIYDPKLADQNIEMATERPTRWRRAGARHGCAGGGVGRGGYGGGGADCRGGGRGGTRGGDCDDPVRRRGQVHERTLLGGRS